MQIPQSRRVPKTPQTGIHAWQIARMSRGLINSLLLLLILFLPAAGVKALPLSPGDRVKVTIPEGEEFSGIFEVNLNGELELPYIRGIPVTGLEPYQLQDRIYQALVKGGYFQPSYLKVSVNVIQWAPVEVFVSGSTFAPGRVLINEWTPAEQTLAPVAQGGQGAFNRFLSAAIRSAGGLLPTADVTAVEMIRNQERLVVDLSGAFTGEPFKDIPLVAGDRVIVPDTGQVNPLIIRPSQITPVGVKIYISNLTVPATSNATSAIGRDATSFPYGSRFSHAVVSGNCAGGTVITNAYRRAVLVRVDATTGKTTTLDKGVEQLLRRSSSSENNPYLMPNDAVACYDSAVTNVRDVLRIFSEIIGPGVLLYDRFTP
ncbi:MULTISPECIES: polysaccharide biosynthesis/export family protein [unclassified Synechococcus]|uniref:polysaccharide biosynthesis/export family protein n=1 Tax=unclassified Synechococcus TaxID=2626047 RepID=UPI0020CFA937|nr:MULTISPECIES: polysaccharide biosynthesis/export family protein [unclassified Synechococcus]